MAEICKAKGINALDAPVSGGRPGAEGRQLTTFVGGSENIAGRSAPMFSSYCKRVFYMGDHGSGQYAKLFNNALMIMNQAAIADIVTLADGCGMDASALVGALKDASGASRSLGYFKTMITEDTVDHLSLVEQEDMEMFAIAMSDAGQDGSYVTERGLHGARSLRLVLEKLGG